MTKHSTKSTMKLMGADFDGPFPRDKKSSVIISSVMNFVILDVKISKTIFRLESSRVHAVIFSNSTPTVVIN